MSSTKILLLGLVLLGPLLSPPILAQSLVVKLCYEDAGNFPWLIKGGHGLVNKLLEMAGAKSGVKIEQRALPWKRCLSDIGYGTQDGGGAASYSDERASFAVYPTTADGTLDPSRRLKTDGYSLYRLKGTAADWDGKQLTKLSGPVGAQLGYAAGADLRKLGAVVDEAGVSAELNMKKLLVGRIQLLALLTLEGDELLERPEFAGKIEKLPRPLSEKPYFIIFNKDFYRHHKKEVNALWAGIAVVRESKEFSSLRNEKLKKQPYRTEEEHANPTTR